MSDNLREPQQRGAIMGTFCDYKLIRTRSTMQVIVEVPVERQAEVFAALGYPMPGQEIHVAIARLNAQAASRAAPAEKRSPEVHFPDGAPSGSGGVSGELPSRRNWSSLPVAQRAAIRCQDERFQLFVAEKAGLDDCDGSGADHWLKRRLGIASKRELATNRDAAMAFERIDTDYMIWAGLIPEPR